MYARPTLRDRRRSLEWKDFFTATSAVAAAVGPLLSITASRHAGDDVCAVEGVQAVEEDS